MASALLLHLQWCLCSLLWTNKQNVQCRLFCPWVTAQKSGRTLSILWNKRNVPRKSSQNLTPCDQFYLVGECLWMGLTSNICSHLLVPSKLLSNYRHLKMCKRACVSKLPTLHKHLWQSATSAYTPAYFKINCPLFHSIRADSWTWDYLPWKMSLPLQRMTAMYNVLCNAKGNQEIACHEPWGC